MAYELKRVSAISDDGEYELKSFNCASDLEVDNAVGHLSLEFPSKRIVILKQNEPFKKLDREV